MASYQARYGELTGPGLNNSLDEAELAMAKFFSPAPSARHEGSLATRYGELMQKLPCFAKINIFQEIHLQPSYETLQKHKLNNMKQNRVKFGVNSTHTAIPIDFLCSHANS
ncbi:hypothetical protein QL285_021926 [Trifolium repens]|nr:hypothetical protein QL285_021926 [Trifolium repens]